MQNQEKFSLLRSILRTLGLSAEAVDDVVDRIVDFLTEKDTRSAHPLEYPYHTRDHFLSPAEQSFYHVLLKAASDWALVCPKVALGDLFYAKSNDASKFRIYTNKIDRKHVDFLVCDPQTVRPLLGIELDDKSHQRDDRRERDKFVEQVFAAARLPLLRVPARQAYPVAELAAAMRHQIGAKAHSQVVQDRSDENDVVAPRCPNCGGQMVLRTAKAGPNPGERFWGCSNYPKCHGIVKFSGTTAQSAVQK